ncbi:MAG: GTP 3',8-cyclase MoaA [Gammaproteobacteria bacterium]|nr:GTP 3',8-cyclase MoaA [Gammaproteobacteria bacterium]NNJ90118.1 GTP 3',8-cyclase MoaA [Gammaproteobacteria bacterium]
MLDPFGRKVSYLRLSVTDRCNFRCSYCMSEKMEFLPRAEILSIEELIRLSSAFVELGVNRLRITGGEPLVRQGLMHLFHAMTPYLDQGRLQEVTLTTNGVLLDQYAAELFDAGVRRINISLDSLDEQCFRELTRKGELRDVLAGIEAADRAGFEIKLNVVALKGINDQEWVDIVNWACERGHDVTFIESMPMGDIGELRNDHFMPLDLVQQTLESSLNLTSSSHQTGGPARYMSVNGSDSRVGFISPYTHNFCESCNRVRVSCTGQLYLCLGQDDMVDLRPVVRSSQDNELLKQAILDGVAIKPKGHNFDEERLGDGAQVVRFMSHTGG